MTEVARQMYGKGAAAATGTLELFVINLCTSMTPMPDVPRQLQGYEKYRLYQISKMEDGRRRYRLRMGFFTNEVDAEFLVATIRSLYPAALVGCALSEDLRFADGNAPVATNAPAPVAQPKSESSTKSAAAAPAPAAAPAKPASAPAAPVATKTVVAPSAPNPAPNPAPAPATKPAVSPVEVKAEPKPAAKAQPKVEVKVETKLDAKLELIDPPAPKAASVTADTPIFHVGRGVDIPESSLELTAEELALPGLLLQAKAPTKAPVKAEPTAKPAAQAKPTAAPVAAKPAAPTAPAHSVAAAKPTTPAAAAATKPAATAPAPKPAAQATTQPTAQPIVSATVQLPAGKQDDYIPILDTTLTIRTLTKAEAEDPNRAKWFVVQLASSESPIDVSTMPKLDIFAAYSLYSVALMEQEGIRHTLRLGFFKEQVSAEAVMGYLKTFFSTPCITQISAAEHDRFASSTPKKPAPAAQPAAMPTHINKAATATRSVVTPTAPVTKPAAAKTTVTPLHADTTMRSQSFLSRLIGKQLD